MRIPFTNIAVKRFDASLDREYRDCARATALESEKRFTRSDVINEFLARTEHRRYLEIGVRDPNSNFKHIKADYKISVDPGVESRQNLATHAMTSDQFFAGLKSGEWKLPHERFDVIFIDGLHLAEQAYKDIQNSLRVVADVGYVILHDCNPPTIHHAREDFQASSPAESKWNGTSWKAFQRYRTESDKRCFVVDLDWGVGVIVNHEQAPGNRLDPKVNPFYEYNVFNARRQEILNLVDVPSVPELRRLVS